MYCVDYINNLGVKQMTYQEKNSIVSILSSLLISGLYILWVFQINPDKSGDFEGAIQYWGLVMVLMIPVHIIPRIIIQIIFSVFNWVANKEQPPAFSDELDKLINLKATRNSFYGFILVFFASMGLLAAGLSISYMFYIMFFGFLACGIISEISELIYYRRGT
jgi:hypothetical protein